MAPERKLQADQIVATGGGGGGLTWQIITSNTTAVPGHGYLVDLSSGPITLTLPSTMNVDDKIGFCDFTGNAATNHLTIARNGNKIMGADEDMIVSTNRSGGELVGTNSAQGWVIDSEVNITGGGGGTAVGLVAGFLQNLHTECTSASQVVIRSGGKVGADDDSEIMSISSDITVDITSSGVNGLDNGSESADTWYYIWMISNGVNVGGLFSASPSSPTLPSGYTKKRLVGVVRNDASSDFKGFLQRDRLVQRFGRTTVFDTTIGASWTAFDISAHFPHQIADMALLEATLRTNATWDQTLWIGAGNTPTPITSMMGTAIDNVGSFNAAATLDRNHVELLMRDQYLCVRNSKTSESAQLFLTGFRLAI